MMRAYRLWDHKPTVRMMLPIVFVVSIIGTVVLAVLAILTLLRTRIEIVPPKVMVCVVTGVPKTIPSAFGVLLLFNFLVILVSIYNALENPRRYESEIFVSIEAGLLKGLLVCLPPMGTCSDNLSCCRDCSVLPYFRSPICSYG
ncbi:hypothetical protein F5146DRAFT_1223256 [Armillaria mellea]|nr:hypothetical protein F5146DRAFT_1223256 [Armillaria mellea]